MLQERIAVEQLGTEDVSIRTEVVQDVSEIISDNWQEAQRSNGFSDGRNMRKVASISTSEYLIALQQGFALDSEDPQVLQTELRRYLQSEAGRSALTVRSILTPGAGNIIIK